MRGTAGPIAFVEPPSAAELLAEAHPFSGLSPGARAALAGEMIAREVEAGQIVFRAGDVADALYLVAQGRVERTRPGNGGGGAACAEVGPRGLFGAGGVVTEGPRNGTVSTLAPSLLYSVPATALQKAARSDADFAAQLCELALLHSVPVREKGIVEHRAGTGEALLLETPDHRFFRLDGTGAVLWPLLDGEHAVSDLIRAALREGVARLRRRSETVAEGPRAAARPGDPRDPSAVLKLCLQLQAAGFLTGLGVREAFGPGTRPSWWRRLARFGRFLWPLRNPAPLVRKLYDQGGFLFFRPATQIVLAGLIVCGLAAFIGGGGFHSGAGRAPASLLPWLYGIGIVSTFCHELGHALATVWCGCDVAGAGVGWFWFGPAPFVDTSPVWRAPRRARILVSLAGPYVTLLFASAASITASLSRGAAAEIAWAAASVHYLGALLNLNPLLKLDGYYVLIDLLDRPNLRSEALRWLGSGLGRALRNPRELREHRVDLSYGAGALLYIVMFAVLALSVYRLRFAHVLSGLVGTSAAAVVAGVLTLILVVLACAEAADDLVPQRRRSGWAP